MRKLFYISVLTVMPLVAWPDCVQISDHGLDSVDQDEYGRAMASWHGEFHNQCDNTVDVYISVDLLDDDGSTLYTIRTIEALEHREQVSIEDSVYVPGRVVAAATDIKINMEERKR